MRQHGVPRVAETAQRTEAQRLEEERQIREYRDLEELISASKELGLAEDEAVDEALRQFGDPRHLGRRMVKEWRIGQKLSEDSAPFVFGYCLACVGGAIVANLVLLLAALTMFCLCLGRWEFFDPLRDASLFMTGATILLVSGPMAGRKLGRRAVPGMASVSLAILALPISASSPLGPIHPEHGVAMAIAGAVFVAAGATAMAYAFGHPRQRKLAKSEA